VGTFIRCAAIVALTGVVTSLCLLVDADLATTALVLLAVVVLAASLGPQYALVAVVCAYVALNWWFTAPEGSLDIEKVEDLVPLFAFALAGVACSVLSVRRDLRPVLVVASIGGVVALLVAADANLVTAALVLLGVVVLTAVMGLPSATTAVVASYLALNYWFTRPIGSLEITKVDDLVPLLAFTVAAATSVATVARVNWLRQQTALTEQRAFEARLARATSDDRAAFLASMTHNLRTPLATIKAALSALLTAPDDDVERRRLLLTNARAETDRLEQLVTKVLELARIHAGGLEPNREPVDLGELAGQAAHRLDDLARERGLRLVVHDDALVLASVDPDMLELVVVVMLENALRYAPAGSDIDVVVTASSDDAVVRVADHGPGIPVAHREEVFEEFVRLDRRGSGSGLGLAIARSMVEAHGGRIWIDETPGGGATIVVSLPVMTVDAFV
jgi:two-component system sensor histidine kinase KdpD